MMMFHKAMSALGPSMCRMAVPVTVVLISASLVPACTDSAGFWQEVQSRGLPSQGIQARASGKEVMG